MTEKKTTKKKTTKKKAKKKASTSTTGRQKTGGRQKGTPNKKSLEAKRIAEELGFSPFEILAHTAMNNWEALGYDSKHTEIFGKDGVVLMQDRIPLSERVKAATAAAAFVHPKLAAIKAEVKAEVTAGEVVAKLIDDIEGES